MLDWKAAVVLAGASILGWAGTAQADSCEADSDCPKGFTCEVTANGTCPASPPCASGKECPKPPACEPTVYRECVPGACERDSDCADGMVCYTERSEACSGGAVPPCAPGSSCPPPPPTVCETQVRQLCVPRYVLPCSSDSDCGAGFDCKAQETCACSMPATPAPAPKPAPDAPVDAGSSSASGAAFAPPSKDGGQAPSPPADPQPQDAARPAPSDGGSMPIPPPDGGAANGGEPVCACRLSEDTKSCSLREIVCDVDSDCPASFSCVTLSIAEPVPACDAQPGADAAACDGFGPTRLAKEVKRCMPPYYGGGGAWGSVGIGHGAGNSEAGGGTPTSAPIPPQAPAPQPGTAEHDAGVEDDADAPEHAEACSVRAPGNRSTHHAGWLWLIAAAGLALAKRRRR